MTYNLTPLPSLHSVTSKSFKVSNLSAVVYIPNPSPCPSTRPLTRRTCNFTEMSGLQRQWRWVVMVASGLGIMIADGCYQATGPYLPAWKEYFNCSMTEVSAIASVNVLFYHIGSLSGTVVNIVGYRLLVMFSGLMAGIGILLSSFVSSRILMVLTYGVMAGTFLGSNYPGSAVAVASYYRKNFSTVWGICSTGTALGLVVMPPLLQYMIDMYGWRGAMLLSSGIMFHVAVCGMLLRPMRKIRRPLRRMSWKRSQDIPEAENFVLDGEAGCSEFNQSSKLGVIKSDEWTNQTDNNTNSNIYVPQLNYVKHEELDEIEKKTNMDSRLNAERTASEKKTFGQDYLLLDRNDVVTVLNHKMNSKSACTRICYTSGLPMMLHSFRIVLLVISQLTMGVCFSFVLSHLQASIVYSGVNSQTASLFVSLVGVGSIVGRAGNGLLVDYGWISAKNLYMVSMAICGLCVVFYRVARAYWIYAVLSIGIGASSGTVFSLEVVLCRVYVGMEHMGRAIGLVFLAHGIGGFIGPVIGGLAYDATGSYDYPFFIYGGIVIVSSLIFLLEPTLNNIEASRAAVKLQDIRRKETSTYT